MKEKQVDIWDVVVIGGGPAGMMAAARASERGRSVLLLEKNGELGKKLSITGGGRCNVTNNKPDVREMVSSYKDSGKFLFSTFVQHGVKETIEWFAERGVEVVEENEGRLFPYTKSAEIVRKAVIEEVKKQGVTIRFNSAVSGIKKDKDLFEIALVESETIKAKACVIATGGTSRPETGSTGDGFVWLEKLGHTVKESDFALVPLTVTDRWVSKVSGIVLEDIKITLRTNGNKVRSESGKVLFTHVGLSGPTILNMSKEVGDLLSESEVTISLDLFPKHDLGSLKSFLQDYLIQKSNRKVRNILSELIPKALATSVLEQLKIDVETPGHSVSAANRSEITQILKDLTLTVKGLLGSDKAVVSDGGVALDEVDFKTMGSRIVPRLYLVGDILDIDRPSGGYSLQLCWSTGFVAGDNI